MPDTWYVTFEVRKRGLLPKRRSPRLTKTFDSEIEAKGFARAKFNEGLVVYAGTINPHQPRQLITPGSIQFWLDGLPDRDAAKPDGENRDEE